MNINDYIEFFDELDNDEKLGEHLQFGSRRSQDPAHLTKKRESKKQQMEEKLFIRVQEIARDFQFTYKAARFEEWWLLDSLADFYEHQWIRDVLQRVKGGKEASVYLCRVGSAIKGDLVAAKVYRPRSLRNLRNDGAYRQGRADLDNEGRVVIDDGKLHAIKKKTEYGRELLHQSWIAYEFTSLQTLHAAGADVPEPYTMAQNAILMGFVGDISASAPTLNEVSLDQEEVTPLFDRVLHNIDILLSHERIHGDLSAYNILYWEGDISLIDFPQVVSPKENRNAFTIFQRDVMRVCEYFTHQGIRVDAKKLAKEIWEAHGYRVREAREEEQ
jgi:RIO kinase 1